MVRELRRGEDISTARKRWEFEEQKEKNEAILRAKTRHEEEKRERLHKRKLRNSARARQQRIIQEKREFERLMRMMPEPIEYIAGDKKLSVLICSMKDRANQLAKLIYSLENQSTNDVEILVEVDNGEITTGTKRNKLLVRARGDYVAFVDDDDKVSRNYIPKILRAIKSNPDCCSLEGRLVKKKEQRTFIHSLQYKTWFERDRIYYRCPNHLNAIRRELALQIGFPDVNKGEDRAFSVKLFPLLKIESVINGPIYYYMKVNSK